MKHHITAVAAAFFLSFSLFAAAPVALGMHGNPIVARNLAVSATISGTTTVCNQAPAPLVTFTGVGGSGNYSFTYTINGGAPQVLNAVGDTGTVAVDTATPGVFTYDLISVTCDGGCAPTAIVGQSAVVTVVASAVPNANIAGTASACLNGTEPNIVITGSGGTAPYVFTYNINGGPEITTPPSTGNSITLTAPTTTLGNYVYNLTSVSSAANTCVRAITKSISISIVTLPTAAISGTVTTCPFTSVPLPIVGTPNATVAVTGTPASGPPGQTFTIFLDATGNGVLNTPATNTQTITYDITSVNTSPPGCRNDNVGSQAVVTVAVNGCAKVQAGDSLNIMNNTLTTCSENSCVNLSAQFTDLRSTTQYTISSIDYCPQALFTPVGGPPGPDHGEFNIGDDDIFASPFSLPFHFCFFGNNYSSVAIGGNGVISFNVAQYAGQFCPWAFSASAPSTALIRNAIFGVYQDTDPSNSPAEENINYSIQGTYPCRKLIVNFYHLGQFQCGQSAGIQTSQIVLYEISNIIEVYVDHRSPCNGWQGGVGVIGIQNAAGTQAYVPPNRNTGNWTTNHEAWRFTPSGPSNASFQWLENGAPYSTDTSITVCPATTSTYTAQVQYDNCGESQTVSYDVVITVHPDQSNDPQDIPNCSNIYDLTQNDAVILGANNPMDFDILYYHTQADAANSTNPILNPTTYDIADGSVIWAGVENLNTGCINTKSFNLIQGATGIDTPSPSQTVCLHDDPPPIQVNTALVGANAITYVYFNSQQTGNNMYVGGTVLGTVTPSAGIAAYDMPALGSAGSLPDVVGTYYVYAISSNPAGICFPSAEIRYDIIALPTATISGTTTICSGGSATITFNGTANATVSYTVDGGALQTILLDAAGTATLTTPPLSANSVYTLQSIQVNPPTGCSQNQNGTATITVQPLPTVSISGDTTICSGQNADVTFTGTPGAVVTYTINSGPSQTTTLSAGGTSVVNSGPLAASATYDLVGIQDGTALGCQQAQSGSVTITVGGLPTASISGDATICPGDSATITFSGTPGATVTYTIGAGPGQTTTLDATTGTASVSTGALATTTTYNLVSVSTGGVPPCAQAQSGTATVTVAPLPTATISGSVSICSGDSATITFGGTPGADVSYNIDGGPTQHTTLDAAGTSSVSTGPISLTTTYNLEGVESATAPGCSQAQSGSAVVGVLGLPTAAISGDAAICQGQSSTITFSGTPGATVHYTIGGGPVQAIVLDAGGNAILPTGALSATTLYSLVDAVSASTPACSQSQSGTATITISPLPTATVSGTVSVCQGDASPQVTFTGSDGTPPYVFTYNINSGPSITSDPSTGDSTIILAPTNLTGSFVYNLLSVQDQGGAGCAQGQSGSATVSVGSAPAITAPDPIDVCDDNNDGYAHFDLTQAIAQITGGDATLVVSFHETLTDAQTGNSPIPTPNDFSNIDPGGQTIHVRVVQGAATGCPSLTTLQLNVNRVPVPNTLIDDYHLCDVNNPGDGQEAFTLQDWNGHVDTESGMAFTYYASQSDAQTGTNPLADPYTNTSATGPEQIWVRVQNAATGCFATASFNLVVDPLPQVTPASIAICGGASGVGESFDLTTVSLEVAQGIPGTSTVFYLDQGDALAGNGNTIADPAHFINTSNPQTVYALVRNTATGCFNITTVGLSVGQGPVIGSPQPLVVCDDNNDGHGVFDLTLSYPDIFGSASPPAGVTATIHETITDAQTGDSPIADLTAYHNIDIGQTVYVRATYDATGCYSITPLALEVNPVPVGADVSYPKCDDNTDGLATFDLTTIVGQVLNGMDPSLNTVSFYVDQADAQVPQNPITNLLAFQNTTPGSQVIYAVVADNATGCSDIVEVTLVVSPLPSVPALGATAYTLCDTDNPGDQQQEFDLSSQIPGILAGQSGIDVSFYVSQADAQTPQNPLPMLYTNLSGVNPQTIWVRLEDATTHCAAYTTLDLRVAPLPVLIPPGSPVVVCDPDGDGIAAFDLQALIPDMLQNASGIDVEFYETPANAQSGNNPLANPYTNIDPYNQTLYVGATDTATGCHSVMPLPIKVIPSPQVPPSLSPDHDITMCDQDADNQNGQTAFDLTANEGYILGLQVGAASDYAISYYLSLADAQSGTAPIAQMTDFTNTANAQTIWVRVQGVGTDCYNISHFDLNVVAPAALTHPTNLNVCDDSPTSANPQAVFDLTVKNAEILGASTATLTYYASQGDYAAQVPISDPSAYTNAVNPQTLIVEATSAQGCKSTTTLTIRVIPLPVPRTANLPVPVLEACDENAPTGSEVFDLTLNEDYIRNNDPDLIFQYYDDAGNLIPDPTQAELATGTVHIRVIRNLEQDYQGQLCSVEMTLPVVVNPLPDVHPATATQCALGGVQTATFILSQYNPSLVTGNADDYDFAYYLNLADAQGGNNQLPDSYVNTGGNPQDVTVRVTDKATGCIAYTTLTLNVLAGAEAFPAGLTSCGDTTGSLSVDLSQFDTTVLGAQGAGFSVAYYPTPGDAQNGTNVLSSPLVTASAVLYAVVTNDATGCHSAPSAVTIVIEPLADPMILNSSNTICVDWLTGDLISGLTLVTNLSGNPNYTLEWYYNAGAAPIATGPTYTISDPMGYGSYSVVATSTSALGCVSAPSPVFTVVQSGPAALPVGSTGYTVSSAFDENQTITVTVEGYGSGHYRYQLDNGPILDNGGIFENVPSCANPITGECAHKVTVYDYAGFGDEHCDPLVIEDIHSIDYPRYFTPNGDGTHDHWNISGLDASAKIYIFDRYGKLLKQIKPGAESTGWDGTFNSEPLPSTDYWFVVQYQENGVQREFRAHFSLKR